MQALEVVEYGKRTVYVAQDPPALRDDQKDVAVFRYVAEKTQGVHKRLGVAPGRLLLAKAEDLALDQ
jgi:hypothetical protein